MKRHNGNGWIVCLGRLRFAWVSPSEWVEDNFPIKNWFFISELCEKIEIDCWDDDPLIKTKKHWQMTILGFQIGFMYKGKPKKLI